MWIGFQIVGHIHKDIDAYFSYLLKYLKQKNMYVFANLMKTIIDSQKTKAFILEFLQEVTNFKHHVKDFIMIGSKRLLGLMKCIFSNSIFRVKEMSKDGLSCKMQSRQ